MHWFVNISVVAALLSCGPTFAQAVAPAKAFGARAAVEQMSLSPDGTKVAYVGPIKGQGGGLFVADLGTGKTQLAVSASGDPERLGSCRWVSNQRLVCYIYGVVIDQELRPLNINRVIAVNADGSNLKFISNRQGDRSEYWSSFGGRVLDLLPGQDGDVLVGRNYVPESEIGSNIKKTDEGYGVDRVNTVTLSSKKVVPPNRLAYRYITDGTGNVRVRGIMTEKGEYTGRTVKYSYRAVGSNEWVRLDDFDLVADTGFYPLAVDPKLNAVYGLEKVDGRDALMRIALDGSNARTVVFKHPQVDVDNVVTIGRGNRVVGGSYATDYRHTEFFDPDLSKLSTALGKAIPGGKQISFIDSSDDEQKLMLWAGSDTDPGQFYLYDRAGRKLGPLLPNRPELNGYKLAEVKPIRIRVGDGTMVPGYLTLPPGSNGKNLPAIVMPHGGPGARDEWGFDWLSQFFANRGFAVVQPNFRGSSGYGDAWFQKNGFQSWKAAIGDVADSGRWLVSEGIADPSKLAILGWSYGGYAALQSGVVAPDLFKAIVAIAPIADLGQWKQEKFYFGNYKIVEAMVGTGPHVDEGSPARHAQRISVPVMMFHGERDTNVSVRQTKSMEERLKSAGKKPEVVIFPKLDHYLEDSAARETMLMKSEAFLKQALDIR